jgi:hypothetical protein
MRASCFLLDRPWLILPGLPQLIALVLVRPLNGLPTTGVVACVEHGLNATQPPNGIFGDQGVGRTRELANFPTGRPIRPVKPVGCPPSPKLGRGVDRGPCLQLSGSPRHAAALVSYPTCKPKAGGIWVYLHYTLPGTELGKRMTGKCPPSRSQRQQSRGSPSLLCVCLHSHRLPCP